MVVSGPTKARKAYKTATACPAGRFWRRLIAMNAKKATPAHLADANFGADYFDDQ